MQDLATALAQRQADQLYRRRRTVDGAQGVELTLEGQAVLSFCSNDYLGLASDPRLVAALKDGADRFGVGSGAAHLISGHGRAHHELEEALADFTGRPRALVFSTGYMANLGILQALLGRHDQLFEDRYNHASLLDAAKLSGAKLHRYGHLDTVSLADQLAAGNKGERLVATDGVFSMDGDTAPLPELARLCTQHDAWLLVDDAHGMGVLGEQGRGSLDAAGLGIGEVPILMATLGKALGTAGAFVAGSEELIETLIQQARTYVYTTATPPALAWATLESLRIVRAEDWRREKLRALAARFRAGAAELGLQLMDSQTPIQPLLVGDAATAVRLSEELLARGILVTAIRPPTVPTGTARLRITFSALHEEAQVDRLLATLEEIIPSPASGDSGPSRHSHEGRKPEVTQASFSSMDSRLRGNDGPDS
ncbi:MAG TPA: 8-amino-7-oxononanoate synthase [Gammaproteobacteria bacterium]|nr:8-amino-7-oxononanoate synthase [Gammaproteobacteria bacterium]